MRCTPYNSVFVLQCELDSWKSSRAFGPRNTQMFEFSRVRPLPKSDFVIVTACRYHLFVIVVTIAKHMIKIKRFCSKTYEIALAIYSAQNLNRALIGNVFSSNTTHTLSFLGFTPFLMKLCKVIPYLFGHFLLQNQHLKLLAAILFNRGGYRPARLNSVHVFWRMM